MHRPGGAFEPMSRTVTLTVEGDVLRVLVQGERPIDDQDALGELRETWARVARVCVEQGIKRVLGLLQLSGRNNSLRSYSMTSSLDAIGLPRDVRVALVDPDADSRRHSEFSGKVASARGWDVAAFATEAQAMAWLRGP